MVLFLKMLVVSEDLKYYSSSGLGRLLLDINLLSQKKSLIALDSFEESISHNEVYVSELLMSSFNLVACVGWVFHNAIDDNIKFPY